MDILKKQLTKLLDVKSLLTIMAGAVFVVLALRGVLDSENVMIILALVFQSYFSYQNNKKQDNEDGK